MVHEGLCRRKKPRGRIRPPDSLTIPQPEGRWWRRWPISPPLTWAVWMNWWRRRESNPNQSSSDNSTDSDTLRTEIAQNHYTKTDCDESPANAKPKDATVPVHFPDTSDTSLCAPGVPERNSPMDSLPEDLPLVVINGIRNWHHLPEQIRSAIETLLETFERARAAESEERHRR